MGIASRDLASHLKLQQVFAPALRSADTTAVVLDMKDFRQCVLAWDVGAEDATLSATNKIELVLRHSDDNVTFTAVTIDGVAGNDVLAAITAGIVALIDAPGEAPAVLKIGYVGGKRYLEVDIEFGGTHGGTGTPMSVMAILSGGTTKPV